MMKAAAIREDNRGLLLQGGRSANDDGSCVSAMRDP